MGTNNSNGCPYRASCGKICTHKGCITTRKHKSFCHYNNENRCPMYLEWLEIKMAEIAPESPEEPLQ